MRKTPRFLLSTVFMAALLISVQSCNNNQPAKAQQKALEEAGDHIRIAYVDIDTLNAKYDFLNNKKKELEAREEQVMNELRRSEKQIQDDYVSFQRKAQSGTMTQAEGEAAEKRLMQMQQSLATRKETLTNELLKEQDEFNANLQERLDGYLEEYNKDAKYDFIFTYSKSVKTILWTNKKYDITEEVVAGLNKKAKEMKDTTAKKK